MITIPFATHRPRLVWMRSNVIDVMDPAWHLGNPIRIGDTVYDEGGRPYAVVLGISTDQTRTQLHLL